MGAALLGLVSLVGQLSSATSDIKSSLDVDVGLLAASTTRLGTGTLIGARIEGLRRRGPSALGVKVGLGFAEEPDFRFEVRHMEIRAQAVGGLWLRRGIGAVGAELGAGGLFVQERRLGIELARIPGSDPRERAYAWATGVILSAEAQARVRVFRSLFLKTGAGPTWSIFPASGDRRWGWSVVAAAGWAFEG